MIALLNCSTSWCQSNVTDSLSSTGGVEQEDSLVAIPISMLKEANAKMVEIKYEKQINSELKQIVANDSTIIAGLKQNVRYYKNSLKAKEKEARKYKRQKNIVAILAAIASVTAIVFAAK